MHALIVPVPIKCILKLHMGHESSGSELYFNEYFLNEYLFYNHFLHKYNKVL